MKNKLTIIFLLGFLYIACGNIYAQTPPPGDQPPGTVSPDIYDSIPHPGDQPPGWITDSISIFNGSAYLPQIVPSSPQAAQFTRYGEIPVGHTTGVPQIEVPIYTLSTGWIDIPITISYHASGFRPRDIPSPVGLGWVLNAGGLISRSIEGMPDFETANTMAVKSVTDVEAMKNGSLKPFGVDFGKYSSCDQWDNLIFNTQNSTTLDTRSDRYTYNFLENSGVARYDVDANEFVPVPYAPLIIKRISKDDYVITDSKGIKYEFTYPDYTKVSNNYQNTATGWYITKITYPGMENDPVVFSYKQATQYLEMIPSQTTSIPMRLRGLLACGGAMPLFCVDCPTCNGCVLEGQANTSMNSVTLYYTSPIITSIQWRNVTIEFNYAPEKRKDQRAERLSSVVVKYGGNIVRQALLNNNDYFGNNERNYRLKLDSISLYGNTTTGSPETYSFNYIANATTLPEYYQYWQNFASAKPCNEDLWGYYNYANSDYSLPYEIGVYLYNTTKSAPYSSYSTNQSANRMPDEDYTKYCMLEEIVYPTKGKTRFEYEINRSPYFYQNLNSTNDKVGGLRLKKRINYSETGSIADVKEYEYNGYSTMNLTNEMFVGRRSVTQQFATGMATIEYVLGLSSPLLSLTGWSGSPVFYNKVTEYNGEKSNYSGKTEYNYYADNSYNNYPSICYYDGTDYTPMNFSVYNDCDKGYIRELLSLTNIFNQAGDTVKKIENNYVFYNIPYIHTGVHLERTREYPGGFQWWIDAEKTGQGNVGYLNWDPQCFFKINFLDYIVAVNTYAVQEVSLPQSSTETDYVNGQAATSKVTSYNYDIRNGKPVLFTPSSKTTQNSNGENWMTTTAFPYSDGYKNTAPYNTMVTNNMLNYPLEIKTEKGTNLQFVNQTLTSYKQVGTMILPAAFSTRYRVSAVLEPRIVYNDYDSYGNPLYIVKDSVDMVVYLWSYKGQYPIAEIRNATYSQVRDALGGQTVVDRITNAIDLSLASIDNLRNLLPDALVTTYTYKPLVGVTSITDPRGVVTYYDYDSFGRLQTIKDMNGKIIENYEYHYKN